jgi:alpha/beta superfamily hydrolase
MTITSASFGASSHKDDMRTQRFDFTNAAGARLSGRLEVPDPPVRTWAVLAHCFTCGKDNLAAVRISRALARRGIGTLRFDFAGLGGSGGVFATGFGADVGDLAAAVRAMAEAGMVPHLLVGHSLGGAAVIAAAGALPMIAAVATVGAPFDVAHVLARIDPATLERIEQDGVAAVRLVDRQFQIRRGFVEEAREQDQAVRIAALRRPLLVLHSPRDETVGIDHAGRIFQAAHHPKSFVSLDDADHLPSRATDADYVAEVITSWASRYLPRIDELRAEGQSGEVVVEETGAGALSGGNSYWRNPLAR